MIDMMMVCVCMPGIHRLAKSNGYWVSEEATKAVISNGRHEFGITYELICHLAQEDEYKKLSDMITDACHEN